MSTSSRRRAAPAPHEAAFQELRQYDPDRVLIVALDIGKDVHLVYARTLAGDEVLPPTTLSTLAVGLEHLISVLDDLFTSGAYDLVVFGHEPTSLYHEPWAAALVERYAAHMRDEATPPLRYRMLVSNQVKYERQRRSHRRRKTDAIDGVAIAGLLAEGFGTPLPLRSATDQRLRLTLAHLQHRARQQMRLTITLLRTLDRLWPGALGRTKRYRDAHPDLPALVHLVESRPLERVRVRLFLEHCPDPHAIRALGAEGIQHLFRAHGHRCGPTTAAHILRVFTQGVLLPPVQTAFLAEQARHDFQLYCRDEQDIATLEAQAVALLEQTDGQVLTTIPGVSALLAAHYLAGLGGDVSRFPSARHVWSFAGYDPIICESGNGVLHGSISKQGSPYLRVTLYQMGFLAITHNPVSARRYLRARERGMSDPQATIHVAHQVNAVCYALLTRQQPYQSPLTEAAAAHWLQQIRQQRQQKKAAPPRSEAQAA